MSCHQNDTTLKTLLLQILVTKMIFSRKFGGIHFFPLPVGKIWAYMDWFYCVKSDFKGKYACSGPNHTHCRARLEAGAFSAAPIPSSKSAVREWPHLTFVSNLSLLHTGKLGSYSTDTVWWDASSGLEGFGNFGRLHYRIKEGGHLPYEV